MAKPANGGPKKAYTAPVLTVYGTVRELTQHVGFHGAKDHPPKGFLTKTHL
jgi:hypothetical protein